MVDFSEYSRRIFLISAFADIFFCFFLVVPHLWLQNYWALAPAILSDTVDSTCQTLCPRFHHQNMKQK